MTLSPGWNDQSPEVQKKFRNLIEGAIEKQVPCLNKPEKWVDYDEEHPPSDREAAQMCWGCPLRLECLDYAESAGVTFGVYGGRVFDG